MEELSKNGLSLAECVARYDLYARDVRGLSTSTREIHCRILHRFCYFRFRDSQIVWTAIRFTDFVTFLTAEFERLPNRDTQRVLLTTLRVIFRYPSETGAIPRGWDEALPRTATRRHAQQSHIGQCKEEAHLSPHD
jgi:hypothetical protein